jgi:NAD(P)-dependent dehydrogenase (short-subunit alcohol dehydrogenase family)
MPVPVTGGAGYIGSQTVLELTDAGETIVVLDNLSIGFEAAVLPTAKLVVVDVGNANRLGYCHNNTCQNAGADNRRLRGPHLIAHAHQLQIAYSLCAATSDLMAVKWLCSPKRKFDYSNRSAVVDAQQEPLDAEP